VAGIRLPVHLDFITSFEALFAVLMIRFKEKGDAAADEIRRQLFVLYELSKGKWIDIAGSLSKNILVGFTIVLLR
jgi:hypothetical protein